MYFPTVTLLCCIIFVSGHYVSGYYWRDFNGTIPEDAFPGGIDISNNPIYIGQVYATYLIPAKIYKNNKNAYYEYGGKEFSVTQNIKILCTENREEFSWLPTNNDQINLISNITLIIGGYEPGCTTYIGRTRKYGEVLIGKVLANNHPDNAGLHITQNSNKYRATSFEVLAFESNEVLEVAPK